MSLPIAHALVGASIALSLWPDRSRAGARRALASGAVLGVLPDGDYLINAAKIFGPGWHHGFTHSIAFAVIVGAFCGWALAARSWRGALACGAALLSHALLDWLVTASHGVALLWPLTDRRFRVGAGPLHYYWVADFRGSGRLLGWLRLCLFELMACAPLLAAALWVRRRRLAASRQAT